MSHGKTLIGNWQEELAYERDRRRLMSELRTSGGSLSQQIMGKVQSHKQVVALSPAEPDGYLRYGAVIMLQNAGTEGYLSTDLDDKSNAGPGQGLKFAVTTAATTVPVARSAFVVLPTDESSGDVVLYGQRVRIATTAALSGDALFLASTLKSPVSMSKVTRNNEVYLSTLPNANSTWIIQHGNADYRPEMEGQPVKVNTILLIQHVQTNAPLASTADRYCNDFGPECEVCGHRYTVMQVRAGRSAELPANYWAFVTAPAAPPRLIEQAEEAGVSSE